MKVTECITEYFPYTKNYYSRWSWKRDFLSALTSQRISIIMLGKTLLKLSHILCYLDK